MKVRERVCGAAWSRDPVSRASRHPGRVSRCHRLRAHEPGLRGPAGRLLGATSLRPPRFASTREARLPPDEREESCLRAQQAKTFDTVQLQVEITAN